MNLYNLMLLNWAAKHDEVYRWKGPRAFSKQIVFYKKHNHSWHYITNYGKPGFYPLFQDQLNVGNIAK